jgi:DNA processing protein
MQREELAGWLRLALTYSLGNAGARRLLAAHGLPSNIPRSVLADPEGFAEKLEATWQWLESGTSAPRHVLTLADARYPAGLLQIADPPLLLYAVGVLPQPWPNGIAIVGSRNATAQGLANARQFGAAFARAGLTVVSGLALGIDGAAHEGALEGGPADGVATVAVVGTGLDRVYPKQHHELAHRIAQRGLIISEFPIGTPPLAQNFPMRNRLIAALSHGTVVVEAALQSGSLITAREAAEQGKEVFAIPGSIHSPQSRGTHALLKQGAKLVETAQDVLEELRLKPRATAPVAAEAEGEDEEQEVASDTSLIAAMGYEPVSLDALVARTGIPPAQLQAQLLELELAGDVARLPGGLFQRMGVA